MNPTDGCQRVRGRMDELLDDALAPVEAAFDRGHVEACAECARELLRREALLDGIRRATAPDPLEVARAVTGTLARLEGASLAPPPRREAGERRRAIVMAVATLAAAAVFLALLESAGLGVPRWSAPRLPAWTVSIQAGADLLSGVGLGGVR